VNAPFKFDAFAAYERERDHTRKVEGQLARACLLLRMACDAGKVADTATVRSFIQECGE